MPYTPPPNKVRQFRGIFNRRRKEKEQFEKFIVELYQNGISFYDMPRLFGGGHPTSYYRILVKHSVVR